MARLKKPKAAGRVPLSPEERERLSTLAVALRKAKDWSQQEVAEASDGLLKRPAIAKAETGESGLSGGQTLMGYAIAFGVDVDTMRSYFAGKLDLDTLHRREASMTVPEPTYQELVAGIRALPKFDAWLASRSAHGLTAREIAKVVDVYRHSKPTGNMTDGTPRVGWAVFCRDALTGGAAVGAEVDRARELEEIEIGQLPLIGQKRLRSAAK